MKKYILLLLCLTAVSPIYAQVFAEYFADKRNPLYNAELAEEEAYELFCEEGLCPFDLLKYGMEHDLLPEAQFPFENGKELLQENWDFVARWFLGEYYEGE